jgi:signal transduction histidine kinase
MGMAGRLGAVAKDAWRLVAHSLSGRLLLLTLFYVMVTQIVIFVPSIARYHRSLLANHIETAEVAILPLTELDREKFSIDLQRQMLSRAGASAVMLKRPEQRELFLPEAMPSHIDLVLDLRRDNLFAQMADALDCLFEGGNRILRIIAPTHIRGAETIEVIVGEQPIRRGLLAFARRALWLALLISLATAILVFASLYLVLVRPMAQLTRAMVAFRENPEDPQRIIAPSMRRDEIGVAERELAVLQSELYGFLQQKGRLAALGAAVAKIQHDLRNILSSAQLASDRLAKLDDPVVQRLVPRLVSSLDHAVALATATLRYGRADEHPPQRRRIKLAPLAAEAGEAAVAAQAPGAGFVNATDPELEVDADPEQLYRILLNLIRNAAEAVTPAGAQARIRVDAERFGRKVRIEVTDNGPGIPPAIRSRLFQPFAGSARKGGSGLGLAIARDLARAHGGDIVLVSSDPTGTKFGIDLPDRTES